jgi:hypothetical protein
MSASLTWPALQSGTLDRSSSVLSGTPLPLARLDEASFRPEREQSFIGTSAPSWADAERDLMATLGLRPGWDSYGGQTPPRELVAYAAAELASLKALQLPAPTVAPSGDGKILASWRGSGIEVELWFEGPYQEFVLIEDANPDGKSFEGNDPLLFETSLALRKIGTER